METKLTYGGEIANFPIEVVEKMLERQFEQTGLNDVSIFEECKDQNRDNGGFDWDLAPEGGEFWLKVIDGYDFERFFEKYPKETKVPVEINDGSIKEFPRLATEKELEMLRKKVVHLTEVRDEMCKQEAIEFAKWIAGYETLTQAMVFLEVENTEELYDLWNKQNQDGNT